MAEDPRGQTWLVSAASMMLVDGWSLIQERSVKLSLALAVLFCLPTLSRTATAQPRPQPALDPDADCRAPALQTLPRNACLLRHVKAVVDLCDFWISRVFDVGCPSMSLTFKLASLVIRTVAKPIGVCNA